MTIGQIIAAERRKLGLSQEQLGEKMGVTRQSISKWESDAALPELEKLIALSRLFRMPVGQLLGIEEPQKLAFMVAFGYPTHKASIVPMTEQTGVKYYLDENRDYCVPKRSAEEIARSL
mgnify:CR=1 FL=1